VRERRDNRPLSLALALTLVSLTVSLISLTLVSLTLALALTPTVFSIFKAHPRAQCRSPRASHQSQSMLYLALSHSHAHTHTLSLTLVSLALAHPPSPSVFFHLQSPPWSTVPTSKGKPPHSHSHSRTCLSHLVSLTLACLSPLSSLTLVSLALAHPPSPSVFFHLQSPPWSTAPTSKGRPEIPTTRNFCSPTTTALSLSSKIATACTRLLPARG